MFVSNTHLIQNTFVSLHRKTVKLSLVARKLRRKQKTKLQNKKKKKKQET